MLELVVGNLLEQEVDAIVVPFGRGAVSASRVQAALLRAANPSLVEELTDRIRALPGRSLLPGHCVATGAHGLPCKHVVHCHLFEARTMNDAAAALGDVLDRGLALCGSLGADTIALPALGTGPYGYRVSLVARVSVTRALAAQRSPGGPSRVRFVVAGPNSLETFLHALSDARRALRGEPHP